MRFLTIGQRVKPGQNKKGQTAPFFKSFLQLAAKKKDSKNGAARKFVGPSYFVTALANSVCSGFEILCTSQP